MKNINAKIENVIDHLQDNTPFSPFWWVVGSLIWMPTLIVIAITSPFVNKNNKYLVNTIITALCIIGVVSNYV